jgi:hypothetical protein
MHVVSNSYITYIVVSIYTSLMNEPKQWLDIIITGIRFGAMAVVLHLLYVRTPTTYNKQCHTVQHMHREV